MISVSLWWTFYFYICNVQKADSVQIFENIITQERKLITKFVPFVQAKTCMLKPEAGPCRSTIKMYYYNPVWSNCSTFNWGGCQGNGNRFDSASECLDYCLSKQGKYRPRFCQLNFDYGFCFGALERWYYDSKWKVCKHTIYSGCGGNKNNFYSQEQCDQICRFGNPALLDNSILGAGGTRKVIIINPDEVTKKSTQAMQSGNDNTTTCKPVL